MNLKVEDIYATAKSKYLSNINISTQIYTSFLITRFLVLKITK